MNIALNDQIQDIDKDLVNLALYGYACYTTLIASHHPQNGWQVLGWHYHLERLINDARVLFDLELNAIDVRLQTLNFLQTQDKQLPCIVRVTVFPKDFSISHPEKTEQLNIVINARPSTSNNENAVGFNNDHNHSLRVATKSMARYLPEVKSTNFVSTLQARAWARNQGFDDALFIQNGLITEGCTWNIFFWNGAELITPSLSCGLLPGITRSLLLEHLPNKGISIKEDIIPYKKLDEYEQVFMTNAVVGLTPIQQIDGKFYTSQNSELLETICQLYESFESTTLK